MPPRLFSRYTFTAGILDDSDILFLIDRERFFYRELEDNRQHLVKEGDTLFNLAAKYYSGFDRPAGLWWIIADFQPNPIHDPTLQLETGSVVVIPSQRTVLEEIFNESRFEEI